MDYNVWMKPRLGDELGDDGEHRVTETVRFKTRL